MNSQGTMFKFYVTKVQCTKCDLRGLITRKEICNAANSKEIQTVHIFVDLLSILAFFIFINPIMK